MCWKIFLVNSPAAWLLCHMTGILWTNWLIIFLSLKETERLKIFREIILYTGWLKRIKKRRHKGQRTRHKDQNPESRIQNLQFQNDSSLTKKKESLKHWKKKLRISQQKKR